MKIPTWVEELADDLRRDAEARRALWPADPLASALPAIADRVEAAARDWWLEAIPVAQASEETEYTKDYLHRAVKQGKIRNAGEDGAPLIRRCDLPRKAGSRARITAIDEVLRRREAAQ